MKKLRIGLIGIGFMGKTHLWSVQNLPFFYKTNELGFTAEVAAVCASTLQRAEAFAAEYGIPRAVATPEEILQDPSIDVVDICTPNPLHFEVAKAAILAGKSVLCEKPLTVTAAEAAELATLAAERDVVCGIVFNNRFLPSTLRAKQLIEEGRLGRILSFRCEYLHASASDPEKKAGWKQNKDICGAGTLYDLGAHAVDMMYHLCGKITKVKARSQIGFPTRLGTDGKPWVTNADEAFYMICETEAGAIGSIEVSKLTVGSNDDFNFAVYGEKGSIRFSLMEPNWLWFYDGNAKNGSYGGDRGYTKLECCGRYGEPGGIFPSFKAPIGWLRGHLHSMYSFLDCVHNGRTVCPSLADGAEIQKVLQMALDDDERY